MKRHHGMLECWNDVLGIPVFLVFVCWYYNAGMLGY